MLCRVWPIVIGEPLRMELRDPRGTVSRNLLAQRDMQPHVQKRIVLGGRTTIVTSQPLLPSIEQGMVFRMQRNHLSNQTRHWLQWLALTVFRPNLEKELAGRIARLHQHRGYTGTRRVLVRVLSGHSHKSASTHSPQRGARAVQV